MNQEYWLNLKKKKNMHIQFWTDFFILLQETKIESNNSKLNVTITEITQRIGHFPLHF